MKAFLKKVSALALAVCFVLGAAACAPQQEQAEAQNTPEPTEISSAAHEQDNELQNIISSDPNDPKDILRGIMDWAYIDDGISTVTPPEFGKYFASESAQKVFKSFDAAVFMNGAVVGYVTYDDRKAAEEFLNEQLQRMNEDLEYNSSWMLDPHDNFTFFFMNAQTMTIYYQNCLDGKFAK